MAVGIGRDIAKIISTILHPCGVFSLMLALIAYQESLILGGLG